MTGKSQCLMLTGVTGSGKTVQLRNICHYLCEIAGWTHALTCTLLCYCSDYDSCPVETCAFTFLAILNFRHYFFLFSRENVSCVWCFGDFWQLHNEV